MSGAPRLFVDTSAWDAIEDRCDVHHKAATAFLMERGRAVEIRTMDTDLVAERGEKYPDVLFYLVRVGYRAVHVHR